MLRYKRNGVPSTTGYRTNHQPRGWDYNSGTQECSVGGQVEVWSFSSSPSHWAFTVRLAASRAAAVSFSFCISSLHLAFFSMFWEVRDSCLPAAWEGAEKETLRQEKTEPRMTQLRHRQAQLLLSFEHFPFRTDPRWTLRQHKWTVTHARTWTLRVMYSTHF